MYEEHDTKQGQWSGFVLRASREQNEDRCVCLQSRTGGSCGRALAQQRTSASFR